MRIPWNKVYRAFPELDRFDDRRCREFIEIACRKFWMSRLITATLGLAVCGAIFVAALIALTYGLDVLWFPVRADRLRSPYYLWLWAGGIAWSGTLVALMGLLLRDRWIRWAVSSQIIAARCLNCEYSLLGLVPDHNTVLCPECGRVTDLLKRGLTADELLAGSIAA